MFALFTGRPSSSPEPRGRTDASSRLAETGALQRVREFGAGRVGDDDDDEDEGGGAQAAAAGGAMNQNTKARLEQAAKASAQSYEFELVETAGATPEEVRARLDERVRRDELDAYLVFPRDVLERGEPSTTGNLGEVFTRGQMRGAVVRAARGVSPSAASHEVMRAVKAERIGDDGRRHRAGGRQGRAFPLFARARHLMTTMTATSSSAPYRGKETRIAEILVSSIGVALMRAGHRRPSWRGRSCLWGVALVGWRVLRGERDGGPVPAHLAGSSLPVLFFLPGTSSTDNLRAGRLDGATRRRGRVGVADHHAARRLYRLPRHPQPELAGRVGSR